MSEGNPYNGYSWTEREENLKVMNRLIKRGELPRATGPCALCGDPATEVEYHGEDYSLPYLWVAPATYILCRHCHRHKLHQRFLRPVSWQAFLKHIRRGGYARDLKDPVIKKELAACQAALKSGQHFELRRLRPYLRTVGEEWFARLSTDRQTLTDRAARPRP